MFINDVQSNIDSSKFIRRKLKKIETDLKIKIRKSDKDTLLSKQRVLLIKLESIKAQLQLYADNGSRRAQHELRHIKNRDFHLER